MLPPTIANILILLGVLQGSILSGIVLFSKNTSKPTRYSLAVFLLILVYNGLETLNWSADFNYKIFDLFTYTWIMGLGPSLYLYIGSFSPASISRKQLWHYTPVLIKILFNFSVVAWALMYPALSKIGTNSFDNLWFQILDYSEWLAVGLTGTYALLAWQKFQWFSQPPTTLSTKEWLLLKKWLRSFIAVFTLFWIFWVVTVSQKHLSESYDSSVYYPIEVAIVVMIYWIGFGSYHRLKFVAVEPSKSGAFLNDFSEEIITTCLEVLLKAMEKEQLYLNPTLSVSDLAKHIGFTPKLISAVLNQRLHKSFNDFVNEYRVEEVKKRLLEPNGQRLTLLGIALESGFNSQATFQRVFKNKTQLTPKDFLNSIKITSQNRF
ncbi:helix-turn-helix domain-containing protein [Runella sp.]|jgi:AraC-like DNA-binding protein|uniref:helix-turn-helix domain-containing protein n=1 Tax=Runella sp. TaxID=1960881 RepID=UPI0026075B2F|nr:helix-turn-helix domain-containing protein [Runella sp.]